uniref:Histone H2A n=1 Tax=Ganoderma boninense TaxID=34458 RepID=A0A5K1K6D3_9APHY|nr:Histone H2A [Ganoderma boninense]
MAPTSMFLTLSFLFAVEILPAWAQNTTAKCRSEFDWMTNSLGQSPCLVTAWLWTPCYGTGNGILIISSGLSSMALTSVLPATFVPPVPTNWVYQGPLAKDPFDSTPCDCNTVLYSTMAACGICQGAGIEPWPTYTVNCTQVYNGTFPESVPGGTAIPAWAFLDVTGIQRNSTFNVKAAKALAEQGDRADP